MYVLTFTLLAGQLMAQNVYKDYQDGRIYVKLKNNVNLKTGEVLSPGISFSRDNLPFENTPASVYGISKVERAFQGDVGDKLNSVLVVEFDNAALADQLIAQLQNDRFVEYAEKIPLDRRIFTPNDPQLGSQWSLNTIRATGAWAYVTGPTQIVIAIVDDAVERFHPDLQPNIWVNTKEIPGNGIDDDNNGFVDDINGWDLANNSPNVDPPTIEYDHGTHVAGIASAATNNNVGISSIGYNCKIMAIKAAGNNPNSITAGYAGVTYAANNGAHVINMSWGSSTFSTTNQSVIEFALSKGCILVAAAGNNNTDQVFYPAGYPGVVSVASTTTTDAKSGFSNYGSWVKISAPGSNILSTVPFGQYANKSGTSMASPLVAGLVGLMKSLNPGIPNNDLIGCLYATADDIGAANPSLPGQMGAGRINATAAMNCIAGTLNRAPIAGFSANTTTIPANGVVQFTDASVYNPTSWSWSFPGGSPSTFNGRTPPAITYNTPGTYDVSLTVTNANGSNTLTRNAYITVTDPPSCIGINLPIPSNWGQFAFLVGTGGVDGFVNGQNRNADREKAMFFDLSSTSNTGMVALAIAFNRAASTNLNKIVPIRVYDGTTNTPGAELGVFNLTMGQIRTQVLAGRFVEIELPRSIILPDSKKFFVSVDVSNLVWNDAVKDSLSIVANLPGQSPNTNVVWNRNAAGTWQQYGTPGTYNFTNFSLFIHPLVTSKPALSVLNPKTAEVCLGSTVEFSSAGSSFADILQWQTPGSSTPTITNNTTTLSPQYNTPGTYKVLLLTRGGCGEVGVDSAILEVKAVPTVTVQASKNPICAGETATITASGASSYVWSPSAGLNVTEGAQVLANPTTTITYNITATGGGCNVNVPFELQVRERTTSVELSASQTNISQPTEVTFTAAGTNAGPTPVYNFKVNGNSRQSGANNTFTGTVAPGDRVVCDLTSSEPCVDVKTVASNELIMGSDPLPVSLLRFSGRRADAGNLLEWITSAEANSDRFEIERSEDGQRFDQLGQVSAAGSSNQLRNYSYTDVAPLKGKNFYRLRMVDKDGTFRYSNTILLQGGEPRLLVNVYPNPTASGNNAVLNISGAAGGTLQVSVLTITGQQVMAYNLTSVNGTLQHTLPAYNLAAGQYLIVCKNTKGEVLETIRWTVTR